jgi:hypothetical protein
MSLQAIEDGIAAVQAGDVVRGEQLLRHGLLGQNVPGSARAVGYMWLATTSPNRQFQIQCYEAAVEADPANQEAQHRLRELKARSTQEIPMPPDPNTLSGQSTGRPSPPRTLPGTGPLRTPGSGAVPQMWEFGVEGGPNGIGTAFLVVRDGLLATTRYVVGSATEVILVTRSGQSQEGRVVRSYPEHDLAFIRARLNVPTLRDFTPTSTVAPETPLIADDYTEHKLRATVRNTRRTLRPGWLPTTFRNEDVPRSFNGAPLIDDRQDLVGMLTRNADRNSNYLYGLHISLVRRKIEEYYEEMQTDPDRMYCGTCGSLSAAGTQGLYYCETCGVTLPFAQRQRRTPDPRARLFYDSDMN